MRKTALVLLLLFLTFLATGGGAKFETARAQELTPLEKVNGQITALDLEVGKIQAGYLLVAGRYLQTLPSTASTPDKDTPQDYQAKPSDVGVSLADLGANLPADLAIKFEIHEYSGPYGVGYRIIAYTILDKQEYRRVLHYGPDPAYASTDWTPSGG